MSKKTSDKPLIIRITRNTRAAGKPLAIGDELEVGKEISVTDAILLEQMKKCRVIPEKSKKPAASSSGK